MSSPIVVGSTELVFLGPGAAVVHQALEQEPISDSALNTRTQITVDARNLTQASVSKLLSAMQEHGKKLELVISHTDAGNELLGSITAVASSLGVKVIEAADNDGELEVSEEAIDPEAIDKLVLIEDYANGVTLYKAPADSEFKYIVLLDESADPGHALVSYTIAQNFHIQEAAHLVLVPETESVSEEMAQFISTVAEAGGLVSDDSDVIEKFSQADLSMESFRSVFGKIKDFFKGPPEGTIEYDQRKALKGLHFWGLSDKRRFAIQELIRKYYGNKEWMAAQQFRKGELKRSVFPSYLTVDGKLDPQGLVKEITESEKDIHDMTEFLIKETHPYVKEINKYHGPVTAALLAAGIAEEFFEFPIAVAAVASCNMMLGRIAKPDRLLNMQRYSVIGFEKAKRPSDGLRPMKFKIAAPALDETTFPFALEALEKALAIESYGYDEDMFNLKELDHAIVNNLSEINGGDELNEYFSYYGLYNNAGFYRLPSIDTLQVRLVWALLQWIIQSVDVLNPNA